MSSSPCSGPEPSRPPPLGSARRPATAPSRPGGRTGRRSPPSPCPRAAAPRRARPRWRPAPGTARAGRTRGRARGARSPPAIWSRFQRDRSWSSSRTRSPFASTRAGRRASCSSISAGSPSASGVAGKLIGDQPRQTDGLGGQLDTRQCLRLRREVPLVEHQVEDGEHRAGSFLEDARSRDANGDAGVADLALRANEPLRDRRLRLQEGARDLLRRQAAQRAQRQRHLRLGGQRWVAAREHQGQPVVGIRFVLFAGAAGPRGLLLEDCDLLAQALFPAEPVDGAVARSDRDPRARVVGRAIGLPAGERDRERFLDRFLGQVEVAQRAGEGSDRTPGLTAEQAIDELFGGVHVCRDSIAGASRRRRRRVIRRRRTARPATAGSCRRATGRPRRGRRARGPRSAGSLPS